MSCVTDHTVSAILRTLRKSTSTGRTVVRATETAWNPQAADCVSRGTAQSIIESVNDTDEIKIGTQFGVATDRIQEGVFLGINEAIHELTNRGVVWVYSAGTTGSHAELPKGVSVQEMFRDALVVVNGETCLRIVRYTGTIEEVPCVAIAPVSSIVSAFTITSDGYALVIN